MKQLRLTMTEHPPILIHFTDSGSPICPVCGHAYVELTDGTWHPRAQTNDEGVWVPDADFSICPCCHTEYGNDDATAQGRDFAVTWRRLRIRWLNKAGWATECVRQVVENLGISEAQLRDDAARKL